MHCLFESDDLEESTNLCILLERGEATLSVVERWKSRLTEPIPEHSEEGRIPSFHNDKGIWQYQPDTSNHINRVWLLRTKGVQELNCWEFLQAFVLV